MRHHAGRPTAWRYLTDVGAGAADGLATDEAMMLHHGRGASPADGATLRLYTYRPHCALAGRYQSLADEVDLDYCREHGVEVGRRPTGGGAILMGPEQLGVALAAPAGAEAPPRELLRRWAEGVIAGLRRLGIEAAFRSKNDLEVGGRKIAGLGLYLDPRGAVLFHASVLVDLDVALMLRVLRIPGAKHSDKAVRRVEERVTTVSRELCSVGPPPGGRHPLQAAGLREVFRGAFAETFSVRLEPGALDAAELARRDALIAERYADDAWIHQRSPRRDARGTALLKTPEGLLRIYVATHGEVIKSALVTGDFNILPPSLVRLEAALRWCRAEPEKIRELTAEVLAVGDFGMPPETVAGAIWEATENALGLQRRGHPLRLGGSCYFPENPVGAHGVRPASGG